MRLIVHSDSTVTLTCPPRTAKMQAAKYIVGNIDWIRQAVDRLSAKYKPEQNVITSFKSRKYELQFATHGAQRLKAGFDNGKILVTYPQGMEISNPQIQKFTYKAIVHALKSEAAEMIPQRMQQLAAANGLHFEGVSITSTISRWGSCNSRKQIRISCFVMTLPDELIDLVLLHELAHTVHMNHSASFHQKLNSMLPMHNEKALNKRLKDYKIVKP
jgi:hypothetical protein